MTMLPPNPADLAAENAADLAAEAGRVFQYLARVARAAANLAEQYAEDAAYLAECAPEGADQEGAEEYARQADTSAETASAYALEVDAMADDAAEHGVFGHVAEDIEPAALAEVAEEIARAMWRALNGVTEGGKP